MNTALSVYKFGLSKLTKIVFHTNPSVVDRIISGTFKTSKKGHPYCGIFS